MQLVLPITSDDGLGPNIEEVSAIELADGSRIEKEKEDSQLSIAR